MLEDTLLLEQSGKKTAFGVVQGVSSMSGFGDSSSTTTLLGGVMKQNMSAAYPLACGMICGAADVIDGTMDGAAQIG